MAAEYLKWTPELVNKFWDNVSQTRLMEFAFAKLGGRSVITAIDHILPKHGRILDFGAGDGHLIRFLAERGHTVAAYEPSKGRAANLQRSLHNYDGFLGAIGDDSPELFDVVIMSEVIEHVLEEVLDDTLNRLANFVRPGGLLVVTTPNKEDLELDMAYCPVSNLLFHRWQHVRSFDRQSLSSLLDRFGFDEVVTHEVGFDDNIFVPHDPFWSGKAIAGPLPDWLQKIRDNEPSRAGAGNRLLYIGRKQGAVDYINSLSTFQALARQRQRPRTPGAAVPNGILMIIGSLGPGGAERQLVALIEQLTARQIRPVTVALVHAPKSARENFFRTRLENIGVKIIDGIIPAAPATQNRADVDLFSVLPPDLADVKAYYDCISNENPEVVHLWMDEVCIKGGIAAAALGVPKTLLCLRNMPPYNFSFYQAYLCDSYRFLVTQPRIAMVNNSRAGAQAYAEWLGLPAGAVNVVHNGLDLELDGDRTALRTKYRSQIGAQDTDLIVGGVFRMFGEKRPLLWLEVAAEVHRVEPTVRFLLVGNGAQLEEVKARSCDLGLSEVLTFADLESNPAAAIAAMDLLFMSSRIEGFPNVLLEAQACGVPVLTTPGGGAPEAVSNGQTGWVLPRDSSVETMADMIVKTLRDSEWRDNVSHHGPSYVATHFGKTRMADEMLEVYRNTGSTPIMSRIAYDASLNTSRRSRPQEQRRTGARQLLTKLVSWARSV